MVQSQFQKSFTVCKENRMHWFTNNKSRCWTGLSASWKCKKVQKRSPETVEHRGSYTASDKNETTFFSLRSSSWSPQTVVKKRAYYWLVNIAVSQLQSCQQKQQEQMLFHEIIKCLSWNVFSLVLLWMKYMFIRFVNALF